MGRSPSFGGSKSEEGAESEALLKGSEAPFSDCFRILGMGAEDGQKRSQSHLLDDYQASRGPACEDITTDVGGGEVEVAGFRSMTSSSSIQNKAIY